MTSSWYKLKFRLWFKDFFYSLRKCNATASAVRGAFLGSKCKWWDPGKVISVNRPYKYNILTNTKMKKIIKHENIYKLIKVDNTSVYSF